MNVIAHFVLSRLWCSLKASSRLYLRGWETQPIHHRRHLLRRERQAISFNPSLCGRYIAKRTVTVTVRSYGALLFGFSSFGSLFPGSVCLPFPLITQRAHPDIMVFDQVMQICRYPQNPGLGPPKRKEREMRAPGEREHSSSCSKD